MLIITGSVTAINTTPIQTQSKGDTLYVGGSGAGNYTRIQYAIDNASDGDTVFVFVRTYPYFENLIIDKSISLIGEDKNAIMIDGDLADVIRISAPEVIVSGFTIQNGENGIWINAPRCEINHNIIIKNGNDGVVLSLKSISTQVQMNNISFNLDSGLEILGSYNLIINNSITNNSNVGVIVGDNDGISNYSIHNNISENMIRGNKYMALTLRESSSSIFIDNFFSTNGEQNFGGWGIYLENSSNNRFIKNKIINTEVGESSIGIRIYLNSNNNIFSDNLLSGAGSESIKIYDSSYNEFYRNHIEKCKTGINVVSQSLRNSFTMNNFNDNNVHATFSFSFLNTWDSNYWDEPRTLPYLIIGRLFLFIPWINVDWHPAQEPYEI